MQALILDIPISQLKTELPGALWFLPILFIAEIIYYPIQVLKKRYIVFILCIFYLIGMLSVEYLYMLPYKISYLPKAILFYGTGHILKDTLKKNIDVWNTYSYSKYLFFLIIVFSILLISGLLNINETTFIGALLKAIISYIGIYYIFMLSNFKFGLLKNTILFLGKNTLVIMSVHVFFMRFCIYLLKPIFNNYIEYKFIEFVFVWFTTILTVLFVNKYAKWMKRI